MVVSLVIIFFMWLDWHSSIGTISTHCYTSKSWYILVQFFYFLKSQSSLLDLSDALSKYICHSTPWFSKLDCIYRRYKWNHDIINDWTGCISRLLWVNIFHSTLWFSKLSYKIPFEKDICDKKLYNLAYITFDGTAVCFESHKARSAKLMWSYNSTIHTSRNSSVGRASDWRSEGPWFDPGLRQ